MGQRSQIYAFINDRLTARYYGWMYGERMISRARHTIEWIQSRKAWSKDEYNVDGNELVRILDTNFDMKDVVISSDISGLSNDGMFKGIECNDGKLFIEVNGLEIKYCFTDNKASKVLSCEEYMEFDTKCNYENCRWGHPEYMERPSIKQCVRNIKWIKKNAKLMTNEELAEFMNRSYEIPF